MQKTLTLVLFLLFYNCAFTQLHPASMPKDSSLSLPEKSFEVFWQTFEDNYAFFKLRNINWKAAYQEYRRRIDATTSDDSLFSVLSQMVTPFKDDHINIIIPGKRQFTVEKPSDFLNEFPNNSSRDSLWTVVDTSLYKKGFKKIKGLGPEYRGKKLFYFTSSKEYGYVRIGRCFVSDETSDDSKADSALAGQMFDSVLRELASVKAIILDARTNIGGNDEFAYAIAGRFVNRQMLGHSKKTRNGGYEEFSPLEKWYIRPQTNKGFTKPVVLLTNDQTASAGDVFAMIMKALPQVSIVGENSLGIYSDM
jgi:carboxyl-terminal processing protease